MNRSEISARPMGFWMALALVMGSMIGSGVFLLPASLAPLGWNSVFGWLITVAGALCVAAVFGRLSRAIPKAGGPYAYTRAAFGDGAGFAIAWAYWISMWVGNAAIATGAVSYLSQLFPIVGRHGVSTAVTIAIVWAFALINISGTKLAGQVQIVWTIVKLLPLVAVIGLAAYILASKGSVVIAPFASQNLSLGAISTATILTLWAMLGLETATVPADKVENPERNISRATLLGTGGAGLIYIIVCSAVVLMLPTALTAASPAPFALFVETYGGAEAGTAIAAFGAISALGALNGWVMCQGELPAAMARDGLFPAFLGKAAPNGTPRNAHLFTTCLLTIVILMNSSRSMAAMFEFLIILTTAIVLVMYLGCAMAAARLMTKGDIVAGPGFRTIVALAALYALWTIYGAGGEALVWGITLLLAGLPVFWLMKIARARGSKAPA
ncbi:MAG: amino acid permease [Sphingomonadaceae bacterium]|nr:amino acid permease [Sphingomonadaceae bacterium]